MNTPSTPNFEAVEAKLRLMKRPLLLTHAKPDGDAIGSLLTVHMRCVALGASPTALLFEPLPDRYRFFDARGLLRVLAQHNQMDELSAADGVIILDTCTYNQLEPLAAWLRTSTLVKIAVDHHVTRDDLADSYVIDEPAAATCLILYDWAKACGWTIDAAMADVLFLGIATDSGWFKHSNTDARVLSAAGDLVKRGAVPHALFGRLYQQESAARFRLRALAHRSLELLSGDRLAVMLLPQTAFQAAGANMSDTEELVNDPLAIGRTIVALLFVEQPDGIIRVGFRSKAPRSDSDPDIDVAAIAQKLGGGGHRRAAGARVRGPLDRARADAVAALTQALEKH